MRRTKQAAGGVQLAVPVVPQPAAIQLEHIAGPGALKRGGGQEESIAAAGGSPWRRAGMQG